MLEISAVQIVRVKTLRFQALKRVMVIPLTWISGCADYVLAPLARGPWIQKVRAKAKHYKMAEIPARKGGTEP